MLCQLSINIPLLQALEEMRDYVMFIKDLVTKKREECSEPANNIHHCSITSIRSLVQKKEDPGSFTIPCTIGAFEFAEALCDLGANINLMSLAIYEQLGLEIQTLLL